MAFVPGGATAFDRQLVWVNREGRQEPTTAPQRDFMNGGSGLALSPDGTLAAVSVSNTTTGPDIWVWTIARGALTRLTFTGAASSPVWTPDDRRICYMQTDEVFCQAADGSGKPLSLFKFPGLNDLGSISPDGGRLVFTAAPQPDQATDIMIATLVPPVEIRPLIKTRFAEGNPRISPDGRWIAYTSIESGRIEVYVRPFPEVDGGRWQVSTEGGFDPRWAKNGRELFFSFGGGGGGGGSPRSFWSSAIQPGAAFVSDKPTQIAASANASLAYDVAADGRLLVHLAASKGAASEASRPQLVVVQHWFDELKARVPATPRQD